MSYQSYLKMKNWRMVQELAKKSREVLRPVREALAADPNPFDLDSLPNPLDLDSLPDPLDLDSLPDPWKHNE